MKLQITMGVMNVEIELFLFELSSGESCVVASRERTEALPYTNIYCCPGDLKVILKI